jgi:hypothetical protein
VRQLPLHNQQHIRQILISRNHCRCKDKDEADGQGKCVYRSVHQFPRESHSENLIGDPSSSHSASIEGHFLRGPSLARAMSLAQQLSRLALPKQQAGVPSLLYTQEEAANMDLDVVSLRVS